MKRCIERRRLPVRGVHVVLTVLLCAVAAQAAVADDAGRDGQQVEARESLIDPNQFRGLAADHRAYRVGDIVMINVLEVTRAKSQAATESGSDLDLRVGLAAPSTNYNASLGFGGGNSSGAQTTRVGELRTQMSAQVVGVEPNGALRISGEQSLIVNGERQKIRLSGLVRREDIGADNAVWSNRIAGADIELLGAGVVSESTRQSILYRVFKWLRLF